MIDDLEALQPVHRRQRAQELEPQLRIVAQKRQHLDEPLRVDDRRFRRGVHDRVRKLLLDPVRDVQPGEDRRHAYIHSSAFLRQA